MTTAEQQLVELRGQMAPLKFAADVARPSADGYTYLNDSARALLLQLDQSVHEVAIAYTASEAKVAELQEALKSIDGMAKQAEVYATGRPSARLSATDVFGLISERAASALEASK